MGRFTGKVAIVTGAASGIGRATAIRLAAEGASVMVADLDAEGAAKTAAKVGGASYEVDVTVPEQVEAMVAATVEAFGGLDVLHNNAAAIGLNRVDQDVVTMDLETWEAVLRVNLTGPMLGCRFAIPRMVERGGGVIVNTSSAAAFYGSRTLAAYGTSKAGLISLTRYVATAYAPQGIRCNAVAPGVVVDRRAQEAMGGAQSERLRSISRGHLTGRPGFPEEVASAVAWLASDEASFVTGEVVRVDGGLTVTSPLHVTDG